LNFFFLPQQKPISLFVVYATQNPISTGALPVFHLHDRSPSRAGQNIFRYLFLFQVCERKIKKKGKRIE
jgi:hypothetical protein